MNPGVLPCIFANSSSQPRSDWMKTFCINPKLESTALVYVPSLFQTTSLGVNGQLCKSVPRKVAKSFARIKTFRSVAQEFVQLVLLPSFGGNIWGRRLVSDEIYSAFLLRILALRGIGMFTTLEMKSPIWVSQITWSSKRFFSPLCPGLLTGAVVIILVRRVVIRPPPRGPF